LKAEVEEAQVDLVLMVRQEWFVIKREKGNMAYLLELEGATLVLRLALGEVEQPATPELVELQQSALFKACKLLGIPQIDQQR
jgi:DNA-binding protein Fis